MINLNLKLLEVAAEVTPEKDELIPQIHYAVELLNEGNFMEADELAHRIGQRINYLMENQ